MKEFVVCVAKLRMNFIIRECQNFNDGMAKIFKVTAEMFLNIETMRLENTFFFIVGV